MFNFTEISLGDEVALEKQGLDVGLYEAIIKYCFIDDSMLSSAQCLKFGFEFVKKIDVDSGNSLTIKEFKELPIWIINSKGEPNPMGVSMVGALSGILNVERRIAPDMFSEAMIEHSVYDNGKYVFKKENKMCLTMFNNKKIVVLIGGKYEKNRNTGNINKNLFINSFFDVTSLKTYTEIKKGYEARTYIEKSYYVKETLEKSKNEAENSTTESYYDYNKRIEAENNKKEYNITDSDIPF